MPDNTGNTFPWDTNTDLPSNTNSELENIMTDKTFRQMSAFNDSPFSPTDGCDTPHADNFMVHNIKTGDVFEFLKDNRNGDRLFNAQDYNKYGGLIPPLPSDAISIDVPMTKSIIENPFDLALNTRVCYLSPQAYIGISIDVENRNIGYELTYIYDDARSLIKEYRDDEKPLFSIDRKYKAIIFTTHKVDEYTKLYSRIYGLEKANLLQGDIIKKFVKVHSRIIEPKSLRWYYENAPEFVIAAMPKETLWQNLLDLYKLDEPDIIINFVDTSFSMLRIMRGMGEKYLFDKLHKDPKVVIDIYNVMDGESATEVEDVEDVCNPKKTTEAVSKHWEVIPNKRQFVSLMASLCAANEKSLHKITEVDFQIDKEHWVRSNIMYGDEENLIFLQPMKRVRVRPSKSYRYKKTVLRDAPVNEGYLLNPFTLVNLNMECAEGKLQRVVVPAIFVKDLADDAEWAEVWRDVRVGMNVFIICFAIASLNPASLLAVFLSSTEILVAMGDLGIMQWEDELRKTPEGQEFLDEWNKFYNATLSITGAAQLLQLGIILLSNAFVRKTLLSVIVQLKIIPQNAASGNLTLVRLIDEFGKRVPANHIARLSDLESIGVFVVKEEAKNGKVYYHAIYGTRVVMSEESSLFFKELRKICRFRGLDLRKQLNELLANAIITERYAKPYLVRDLQPVVTEAQAVAEFGEIGGHVVRQVDRDFDNLVKKMTSNNQRREKVMISGMGYTDGKRMKVFTATNFTKAEINDGKFAKFVREELHHLLKTRYLEHLKQEAKGLKVSLDDYLRGGIAGSHGEIRALNDLLKEIDPHGLLTDDIFSKIVGYNRMLVSGKVQPTCAHCYYMTDLVKFIGL